MKNIVSKILIGLCIVLFITVIVEGVVIKNKMTTINNQAKQISELENNKAKIIQENSDLLKKKDKIITDKDKDIDILKGSIELLEKNRKLTIEKRIEYQVQQCMKKVNYATFGMSYCIYDSEDDWNKQISKHLSKLKKTLTKEEYALLLKSQKDWEQYKKSQINFIQNTYRKTLATIYHNYEAGDIVSITENRAKDLYWISDIMKRR